MTLEPWRRKYELIFGPYGLVRGVVEGMTTDAYEDDHTLFSRSHCTPRVRVGATSSKGPLIYPSSATFCAHFGPCVGDLHPPHFARIFEPDHRPPHFRRKFKPMRAPGEAAANSPTGGGVRAVGCDSHVSDAMGEMTSCGRRSVGPGR